MNNYLNNKLKFGLNSSNEVGSRKKKSSLKYFTVNHFMFLTKTFTNISI